MLTVLWIVAVVIGFVALAYLNVSGLVWAGAIAAALAVSWLAHALPLALNVLVDGRLHRARGCRCSCRRCAASS